MSHSAKYLLLASYILFINAHTAFGMQRAAFGVGISAATVAIVTAANKTKVVTTQCPRTLPRHQYPITIGRDTGIITKISGK
jgi:hypothetical protein